MSSNIPAKIKGQYIRSLLSDISERVDMEDQPIHEAFPEYCMELWGLTSGDGASKTDGAGDRGLDWYRIQDNSADIWQFKSPAELSLDALKKQASPDDLADVRRLVDYVATVRDSKESQNKKAKKFQTRVDIALGNAEQSNDSLFFFNIHHVMAKTELTQQAQDELAEIKAAATKVGQIGEVLVEININVYLIDDILAEKWRQDNATWTDASGEKSEKIMIRIDGNVIDDKTCQVFFGYAHDLVEAYANFGQRLFAPNVRCYLSNTPVNQKIQSAIQTEKGISNFKFMNNGVTIIAENVDKKSLSSQKVSISKPGIVNGLQTVRSLYEGYQSLKDEKTKSFFRNHCLVMIRVFGGKKLPFKTEDLVIATNNQNRMEPRNLRSNTTTQKAIERDFAKLGWFYERKEKAWEAFVDSDGQWDTLKGHKPNKFGGRGKDRRVVDNIDVATAALAFSGFSDVARDRKSAIFSEDRLYRRVFEMHSAKHGARFDPQFQYPRSDNSDLIQNEVPAASILLLAQLTYLAAKQVAPKSSEMKAAFAERLGVTNETIEKKNAALLDDPGYLAQLMMLSSPMLLTELIGYAFYEIPIDRRPAAAEKILKTTDFKSLFFEKDFNAFKINTEQPIGKTDFFRGFYKLLEFILTEFADSTTFRQDLLSASSRPSYIHGKSVRRKIIERVSELDSQIRRNSALSRDWSAPFDENKSITKALAAFTIN